MVKGKFKEGNKERSITPSQAKWLTTRDVLTLFNEEGTTSWKELWKRAKASKIPFPTLKRTVKRLVDQNILKPEAAENFEIAFTPLLPLPSICYLIGIIQFLEGQLESLNKDPAYYRQENTLGLFADLGWEKIKPFITESDERKLREAEFALCEIRSRVAISMLNEEERRRYEEYDKRAEETAELLNRRDHSVAKKLFAKIYTGAKERKAHLDDLIDAQEAVVKALVLATFDNTERMAHVFSPILNDKKREQVKPLINWLKANRDSYDKYLKKEEEAGRVLFVVGSGFKDYEEEAERRLAFLRQGLKTLEGTQAKTGKII